MARKILPLILFLLPMAMFSQIKYADNLGKDFWLVFPPNYHNEVRFAEEFFKDSLFIYIAATKPTSVSIVATDKTGNVKTSIINIIDTKRVYEFSYLWKNYEILGFNYSGQTTNPGRQDEIISDQAFHITSDEEITVYALSHAQTSTDAALILPTDVLSKSYCVASYNSDGIGNNSTPSQFVVLATEDNTQVRIEPKVLTSRRNSAPFSITLDKGQSFLVQANTEVTEGGDTEADLTGSFISSSKPIAVFSGHQRSKLPITLASGSRDMLFEQLPGIEAWGKSTVVVPFAVPDQVNKDGEDLYRMLAAYDSTKIFLNGVETAIISRGGFYESALTKAARITSSKPILVTSYKKTSGDGTGSGNFKPGDPFMTVTPPTDQFLNSYLFINPQVVRDFRKEYTSQFVTIVVPDIALDSVTLDEKILNKNVFTQIPQSGFSFSTQTVGDGTHTISCTRPIGIYVYGYGNAVSYGYVGGMRFRPLDNNPPQMSSVSDCFDFSATIYDTLPGDSKILSVELPEVLKTNVKAESILNTSADSINVKVSLLNKFLDGSFTVIATDSVFQKTEKAYTIPGFTVASVNQNENNNIIVFSKKLAAGRKFCFPITIENYGGFTQSVSELTLKNKNQGFSITESLPIILKPREQREIIICFNSITDSIFVDTLIIGNDCINRSAYAMSFKTIVDRIAPDTSIVSDICRTNWDIIFTELAETDLGLREIVIYDSLLINCSVQIVSKDSAGSVIKVVVNDVNQDAEFTLKAIDSTGNSTTIYRAIPGYTLSFSGLPLNNNNTMSFGGVNIGTMKCDTFMLFNYGKYPLNLTSFVLDYNIRYSIPPSQFPLTVAPKDSLPFVICYEPKYADNVFDEDAITVRYNCSDRKLLVSGKALQVNEVYNFQCDVPVKITGVGEKEVLSITSLYPQPVSDIATMELVSHHDMQELKVIVVGTDGNRRIEKDIILSESGRYFLNINIEQLESGNYTLILTDGINSDTTPLTILR